jgi:hypothetical protein
MPATLSPESVGPVDVAVIRFDGNRFSGDVAPSLADLHDRGVVRIIDLAFVRKEQDGTASYVEVEDAEVGDVLASVHGEQFDLLNEQDLTEIADALEPESSALVIVWENTWAGRLAAAIRDSHGSLVVQERIPRDVVLRAVAALDED